jgi:Cytochrome C oxidase, cbb3-type, subunit III
MTSRESARGFAGLPLTRRRNDGTCLKHESFNDLEERCGEIEYQMHCAVCHGRDGRGDGIMVKYLTIQPSDLTRLSVKSRGEFPFWRVYSTIDGREDIAGHGNRSMPIWGARFKAETEGGGVAARATIAGRILGLVFYIRSIQER